MVESGCLRRHFTLAARDSEGLLALLGLLSEAVGALAERRNTILPEGANDADVRLTLGLLSHGKFLILRDMRVHILILHYNTYAY